MRLRFLPIVAIILCLQMAANLALGQDKITLGPGTQIPVRIVNEFDSQEGSLVHAVVDRPVTSPDGTLLIVGNTPVEMIAQKIPSRGLGKPGSIRIFPVKTFSMDNQIIMLNGGIEVIGQSKKGLVWGLAAGTFVSALTIGTILMASGFNTDLDDDSGDAMGAAGAVFTALSPLGWLFLLKHGEPAKIPAGQILEHVYPRQTYSISTKKDN